MAAEFDFAKLRTALEESDARSLLELYADNATMKVVDRNRPPSSPMILDGKHKIEAFWYLSLKSACIPMGAECSPQ
jgi:hypothetical protein